MIFAGEADSTLEKHCSYKYLLLFLTHGTIRVDAMFPIENTPEFGHVVTVTMGGPSLKDFNLDASPPVTL
jgi:hypothetical protein